MLEEPAIIRLRWYCRASMDVSPVAVPPMRDWRHGGQLSVGSWCADGFIEACL
jgi:hypothetical protein